VRRGPPTSGYVAPVDRLLAAYYDEHPDPSDAAEAVSFGTSGHRGSSLTATFNEDHVLAIT
jgi:phosphoglucomutase